MKNYFQNYDLFSLSYFRNLLACILLKFFNYFLDVSEISTKIFIGIVYIGNKQIQFIKQPAI